MATATGRMTLEQFHELYDSENGYEYWFGKAVRKHRPTWTHAILQGQLVELLTRLGYFSGSELTLRVDSEWEPRPDVEFHQWRFSVTGIRGWEWPITGIMSTTGVIIYLPDNTLWCKVDLWIKHRKHYSKR